MNLRISVINLQSGIGMTKGYREYLTRGWKYLFPHRGRGLAGAGKFLRESETDISLLTEVEESSRRSQYQSHTELLKESSGLQHAHFYPVNARGTVVNEGNAILSRYPIGESAIQYLSGKMVPRALGKAVLNLDGTDVTVFVAHLALGSTMREIQLREIARIVKRTEGPIILGGDFNAREHSAFEILKTAGLPVFCTLPNFPSWKPVHALQVLFLSSHFVVDKHYIPKGVNFSDHLPLVVEARLR